MLAIGGDREIHQKIIDLGADVHYLVSNDKLRQEDIISYSSVSTVSNTTDVEEWILTARTLHKIFKFTKVGCFHEKTQVLAAQVANTLGIAHQPCELFSLVQNKNKLRDLLIKNNLDNSYYYYVDNNKEEIEEIFLKRNEPLIAKPVDGYASIGVYRIDDVKDVEPVCNNLKKLSNNRIYLEKLMSGAEYSVEIFSTKGVHYLLALTLKYNETERFIDLGHILPTFNKDLDRIFYKVKLMLDLIKYNEGVSHTEVIVSDSDVFITETHCRIAGDYIPEMIKFSFELDVRAIIAKHFLDISVVDELSSLEFTGKYSAVWFKRPLKNGIISKIEKITDSSSLSVIQSELYCHVGTEIRNFLETSSRLAYSINEGSSHEEALSRSQETLDNIKISIE